MTPTKQPVCLFCWSPLIFKHFPFLWKPQVSGVSVLVSSSRSRTALRRLGWSGRSFIEGTSGKAPPPSWRWEGWKVYVAGFNTFLIFDGSVLRSPINPTKSRLKCGYKSTSMFGICITGQRGWQGGSLLRLSPRNFGGWNLYMITAWQKFTKNSTWIFVRNIGRQSKHGLHVKTQETWPKSKMISGGIRNITDLTLWIF